MFPAFFSRENAPQKKQLQQRSSRPKNHSQNQQELSTINHHRSTPDFSARIPTGLHMTAKTPPLLRCSHLPLIVSLINGVGPIWAHNSPKLILLVLPTLQKLKVSLDTPWTLSQATSKSSCFNMFQCHDFTSKFPASKKEAQSNLNQGHAGALPSCAPPAVRAWLVPSTAVEGPRRADRACPVGRVQSPQRLHGVRADPWGGFQWGYPAKGPPRAGWFTRQNPIEMDDLGVSPFVETLTCRTDQQSFLFSFKSGFVLFLRPLIGTLYGVYLHAGMKPNSGGRHRLSICQVLGVWNSQKFQHQQPLI